MALLASAPGHGYRLIYELGRRSGGFLKVPEGNITRHFIVWRKRPLHFGVYVLPRSYAIAALAIVVAALASELPALRTIASIDLAATVREPAA
jgi:hypothetical protein